MSDEKFEEFLQREAKAYNAPPSATPRDAMWGAISEARAQRRGATPLASRKPRLRYAPWIGMAATLLIGVGIGRYALQRDAAPIAPTSVAALTAGAEADQPNVAPGTAAGTTDSESAARDAASQPERGAAQEAGSRAAPQTSPDAPRAPRRLTGQRNVPAQLASATSSAPEPIEMATSPEQVASREHMQRAEALITVVAAAPADAMMDSLTGRWAREMLTNTRLLLDSPAGDDIARRRLLEDLETLLVQLVQRSGGAVDERFLIDRTLERTQLLTRLRTSAAGI